MPEIPPLPARPGSAHKGTFGTCLLLGGSRGMMGALVLAGRAALRSGVGLVRLGVPESQQALLPGAVPEATSIALREEEGALSSEAVGAALEAAGDSTAVGLGPGLSERGSVKAFVRGFLRGCPSPLVLDADGLNALEDEPERLRACPSPVVVTPHPGEASRLLGLSGGGEVQGDREGACRKLAERTGAVVVLKGEGSLVHPPPRGRDVQPFVNRSGNPGMATGGSGDVLTGILASLLAQGMEPFEAAKLAVHAHGLAGDLGVRESGSQAGLVAGDLVDLLPRVWSGLGGA